MKLSATRSLLALSAFAPVTFGATTARDFADLTLEELMQETVTSVSKREEPLFGAASAVTVVSPHDIARSGATTVTDALRHVPGLNIGAVNANETAVSARGFNNVFANKLLVLVDGRAVYNPIFSGTYWDLQQMILEDVDRIEVIRGPGGTLWGANAVNGVINVVSRDARDTQGGLLYGGGGNVHESLAGFRFGGQLDERTHYRVFARHQSTADYNFPGGTSAGDDWTGRHGGFRIDRHVGATHLTWQGDGTTVRFDDGDSTGQNLNTLVRLTRDLGAASRLEIQSYYEHMHRDEFGRGEASTDTFDVSAQHTVSPGDRTSLVWGLGYRYVDINVFSDPGDPLVIRNDHLGLHLVNAFVQGEVVVVPDTFTVTSGVKIEHNDFTGIELQPNLRATYKPTSNQTLWSAVSRAVRTPSALDGHDLYGVPVGAPFPGPGGIAYIPTVTGNRDADAEVLWAIEFGYRIRPTARVGIDVAFFHNTYDGVLAPVPTPTFVPGFPVGSAELPFDNIFSATTWGGELSATWSPSDALHFSASYSLLVADLTGPAGANAREVEDSAPRNQIALRTTYEFSPRADFTVQARYIDAINTVPSYLTADIRFSWRPRPDLELTLVGQNLLDPSHPEQGTTPLTVTSEVPRSFHGKITWHF